MATGSQTPTHVQYRNATYYGQLSSNYKRNGKGMIILDTSTVLFADWKDNIIDGTYIYISDGIRAYGNMINGKLDGYNIISTTNAYTGNGQSGQYSNNISLHHSNVRTFYGCLRNQKIYGRCLIVDNDQLLLAHYTNNQPEQINRPISLRERELYDFLKQLFPNHLYTLEEHLTRFIKTYIAELQQLDQIGRYQPCINLFSEADGKFYGFQEVAKPNKKFGMIMRDNQLISVGEHHNNLLQGIGRLYEKDHVLDGAFRNGKVDGIGIDFSRVNNKFVLEVRDGVDDRVERGFGFPIREILEFRKQFHLRSIFFYNDIAILNLKQKFEGLIGHIFVTPKRPNLQSRDFRGDYRDAEKGRFSGNSRSASKRMASSPLRERLSKYQLESDVIQDNSPIRNRPNQYKPIDRASGYFRQDTSQPRSPYYRGNDRSRNAQNQHSHVELGYNQQGISNSRRFTQTHGSNRSQERNDRYSQENRSKNKFQEREYRQKETYNEILRQNPSNYYDPNPSHSRASRTYSNYNARPETQSVYEVGNRGRKDTRDLVKELETQEKGRRLALDQIYSKSNLYGRSKR